MNYQTGDTVIIDILRAYTAPEFPDAMLKYYGNIATIVEIINDNYLLDVDNGEWLWIDEMLEPANNKED